jgi:methanogenic corrinoid protein MtbC1
MTDYSGNPKYRIKAVSYKTGILPVTIRAWERRYQVLTPNREDNSYRLYTDHDIEILKWLKYQVDSGISISQAADEIKKNPQALITGKQDPESLNNSPAQEHVPVETLRKVLYKNLIKSDEPGSTQAFEQTAASLTILELFEKVIIPILVMIGDDWYNGRILIATEHFASNFIQAKLMAIFQRLPLKRGSKRILVGGAPGEMHELGALMLAILLRQAGFQVEYLGPDLPLDDLVEYAAQEKPDMIILAASTTDVASELRPFKTKLDQLKAPPLFGFGGGAFLYAPALAREIPGIYLGSTMGASVETVTVNLQGSRTRKTI